MARYRNDRGSAPPQNGDSSPPPAERQERTRPVAEFQFPTKGGNVEAAIWENMVGEGRDQRLEYAVTVQRSYYSTAEKKMKSIKSFRQMDIPALRHVLDRAARLVQRQSGAELLKPR